MVETKKTHTVLLLEKMLIIRKPLCSRVLYTIAVSVNANYI